MNRTMKEIQRLMHKNP